MRIESLVIDSRDPGRLAGFWAEVLGWTVTQHDEEEVVIKAPEESPAGRVCSEILFGKSDAKKVIKNRLHLDLRPSDKESEIKRVLSLGARKVDIGQDGHETWTVLADPEGNEFCILRALTEEELDKS